MAMENNGDKAMTQRELDILASDIRWCRKQFGDRTDISASVLKAKGWTIEHLEELVLRAEAK